MWTTIVVGVASAICVLGWTWCAIENARRLVEPAVRDHAAGFDDTDTSSTMSTGTTDPQGWAPLWMIAVVAIAPCIVTVVLAWRAASSVEDAVTVAASRGRVGAPTAVPRAERAPSQPCVASRELSERIEVLPGADTLRLAMGTFLAGAALLSPVGAGLVGLLWFDSRETGVLPVQRRRAWDALEALEGVSRGVTIALDRGGRRHESVARR